MTMTDAPPRQYLGKYRGMVLNNIDPKRIGRLFVQVSDVSGMIPSSWAMPCLPLAGAQMGMHLIPPIGAGVWIEFEQGNPNDPIWVGCWWGSVAEVPALALAGLPVSPNILMQTPGQHALVISDLPGPTGGIMLKSKLSSIVINDLGITITNGQASITMTGPTVTVNKGALVVT